jgi:hypothetical protein
MNLLVIENAAYLTSSGTANFHAGPYLMQLVMPCCLYKNKRYPFHAINKAHRYEIPTCAEEKPAFGECK